MRSLERLQGETDAKIKVLQEQRAGAKADAKAKHDKRIAELRADYDRRVDKLIQASEMASPLARRSPVAAPMAAARLIRRTRKPPTSALASIAATEMSRRLQRGLVPPAR